MSTGWRATESRLLEPYLTADGLLHRVKFRCRPTDEYEEIEVHWFDRDAIPGDFEPAFSIDVDFDEVSEKVDIPREELAATIVVRDRARKRWVPHDSWALEELPTEIRLDLSPADFALARRMEFVFMISPVGGLKPRVGRAFRRDQVVASRTFQTNLRRDGSRFNVSTMPPEWFEENGMSRDTVWAIDWESRDPYLEPVATLLVVINERYEQALRQRLGGEDGKLLAAQMAADVFLEASLVALEGADTFEPEPSTLLGSVLAGLGISTSEEFDVLKDRVAEDAGRLTASSLLRSRIQAAVGLGRVVAANGRRVR